ncbi:NADH-quinone oxidoreductase subunit N [Enterobacteriaceae endosymbiont of Donacia sparganii]|uniref:NADH-quinone oxidoreductase subunit N n=1 Tax=Enterobacteriaceae endosymbiont of Donacia sparganii TaxID=2675785 RepID=UPI001449958F|nr:NADH-quinone oxidoreductase subunit N [Enterobacteriaceae endosymbiont of Donacia sparganii]QJC35830.1 NADH-quinone oxidoreductase subunit NuoN [Enterobacteriaceae endosymbiont of Donacia sparganii]
MTKSLISLVPLITIISLIIILLIKISIKRNNLTSLIITILGFILTIISIIYTKNNNFLINSLFLNDTYSIFYIIILICNNILICLISYQWLSTLKYNKDEFYILIIISTLGSMVLINSNNLISMLIGIELISIPTFGLISYNIQLKYSLEASIKYVILSTIASSFLILGISFIYLDNGSLNFIFLLNHYLFYNKFLINYLTIIGLCLIFVSLGFKLSIVPFHLWTPDVYQGAPTPVTMFLNTFSKSSIFIFLVKFLIYCSKINNNKYFLYKILILISILSIIFGNIMGIMTKNNIKRLLAYSSIAHIGYMFIILIYNQKYKIHLISLEMMGIYIIGYIINNLGILGVISLFSSLTLQEKNIDKLYFYRGLFWYDPILTFTLTIMLLSLAGIPITIGFISKFYLIALSIKIKIWYLTAAIILGSSIGLYYYLRIIISLYLNPSKINKDIYLTKIKNKNYFFIKNILLILSILTIIIGLYPEFIIQYIKIFI